VLVDTYKGPWVHDPGRVFTDLAAAVAERAARRQPVPRCSSSAGERFYFA